MSSGLQRIRGWFRRLAGSVEEEAEGGSVVAKPPPGSAPAERGESERETSTNAQVEGAVGQPWPGNR